MYEAIIPAAITAITSVVVVCVTQYKSKKIAFFQTYFNKKMDVYSAFWKALDTYEIDKTPENWVMFKSQLHAVSLFAPDNIYHKIVTSSAHLVSTGEISGDDIFELVTLMRNDLEACKRMKF